MDKLRKRKEESKEIQRLNFNLRHNATPLKTLQPGTFVHIKDMGAGGTAAGSAKTPRSYLVKTENGTVRRNRSHLIPIPTNEPMSPSVLNKPVSPTVEKIRPRDKALTPEKPLPSLCPTSRPKRLVRPSLKLKESLRLS